MVGFRTEKSCDDSHDVTSVQPIYYSVNEKICDTYLNNFTYGMLQEIPNYGITCDELISQHSIADLAVRSFLYGVGLGLHINDDSEPEELGKSKYLIALVVCAILLFMTISLFNEARKKCWHTEITESAQRI